MYTTLAELIEFSVKTDLSAHRAREVFFERDTWKTRFIAVDVGGWFSSDLVLVSTCKIQDIDAENREIVLSVTDDDLKSAENWRDHADENDRAFMSSLPPVMVGPFGGTYAPMLLYASMSDAMVPDGSRGGIRQDDEKPPPPPEEDRTAALDRFTGWRGLEAFGSDGALGRIEDMVFDLEDRTITHFVIDSIPDTDGPRLAPVSFLRHLAEGDTHAVLNVTRKALAESPQPDNIPSLDRVWMESLFAGYI